MKEFSTYSPIHGELLFKKPFATDEAIRRALDLAQKNLKPWQALPLQEKQAKVETWLNALEQDAQALSMEVCLQMGRPLKQIPGELRGMRHRADTMQRLAPKALGSVLLETDPLIPTPSFQSERSMERSPLGVVLILAPWNYPYLTVINSLVPALLAGNAVILKHSPQTALCGERIHQAALNSEIPLGILQHLHLHPDSIAKLIEEHWIQGVSFTGSVEVGQKIHLFAAKHLIPTNLELGGNDAAYVRPDAVLDKAVESLVDGAFFNAGQSCCGIERIYVHKAIYQPFIQAFEAETAKLTLGDPRDPSTTLGPVAHQGIADKVRLHLEQARSLGAEVVTPVTTRAKTPCYIEPHILYNVTSEMMVLNEETFGPVVCLIPVGSDDEAIEKINDSLYGLTASIWSEDFENSKRLSHKLEVGTAFINRCDYLDPNLAWTGLKLSGQGVSLSEFGFQAFTQLRSFYLRTSLKDS